MFKLTQTQFFSPLKQYYSSITPYKDRPLFRFIPVYSPVEVLHILWSQSCVQHSSQRHTRITSPSVVHTNRRRRKKRQQQRNQLNRDVNVLMIELIYDDNLQLSIHLASLFYTLIHRVLDSSSFDCAVKTSHSLHGFRLFLMRNFRAQRTHHSQARYCCSCQIGCSRQKIRA